ncbi:MAG: cytochrome C oxidase subunit IV family protein [Acidimicrobiales bacterium]|nr:cytochrome C oxidase subunit IV family protein [Acidimicrobiales bacterium]
MTATEQQLSEGADESSSWVKQDMVYIKTAIVLGVFTAIEVFTYFESVHKAPDWLLVITLSFLMVIKFFLVTAVFMHLRDDNAVFTKLMVLGLCIAWPVYFIMAFTFGFLPNWNPILKVLFLLVPPSITGSWLGFSFKGGTGSHH